MHLKTIAQHYSQLLNSQLADFNKEFLPPGNGCEFSNFLQENAFDITTTLKNTKQVETLADLFANIFYSMIYQHNQFIFISDYHKREITLIDEKFIKQLLHVLTQSSPKQIAESSIVDAVNHHLQQLATVFKRFKDLLKKDSSTMNLINNKVACYEYSVELQLNLLSIDPAHLKEPILDIGCGENALLVTHLSDQGYDVTGIDRHSISPNNNVTTTDWFSFEYKKNYWGTIISQMAFSNHFIFHHLNINGNPEQYAKTYMSILNSLIKGGSFYYTPGLPFIEEHLPENKYKITTQKIENNKLSISDTNFQQFKKSYLYSTRVMKLFTS